MNIFDCTTFFDEKLMMDVRFNVLDEYVSKFVVVESTYSHSGKKKVSILKLTIILNLKIKLIILLSKKNQTI